MYDIMGEIKKKGVPAEDIDHHDGDLYLRVTPLTTEIIKAYPYPACVSKFISNIEPHVPWYDIWWAYHD